MSTSRQRAKEVFLSARDLPEAERDGFVSAACAGDAELEACVRRLLAADVQDASSGHSVVRFFEEVVGGDIQVALRAPGKSVLPSHAGVDEELAPRRGPYRVLGELARGGMGVVLKSRDQDLGREVAMKVLHGDAFVQPETVQRFIEEAQIGGQLQHPGIVPVYELGRTDDEQPYFTMRLIEGRTFASLLEEREHPRADRARILDVFADVCQAMAYAHSRGVIHRDLKPANVMVGAFGEVQVVDWGLAKVLEASEAKPGVAPPETTPPAVETLRSDGTGSHSIAGAVMGTVAYMPPEQARGEIDRLDERADVFALGAILCEILTGRPPYAEELELALLQAAQGELDEAHGRLQETEADDALVALAGDCLQPERDDRPPTAGVVAERMRAYQESVEERALAARIEAAEARVHASEERRARRLTLGLAASVCVTIVAVGGGWLWTEAQSAERERESAARVAAALEDAAREEALERWPEAVAAAERAVALAGDEDASVKVRERATTALASIEARARSAIHAADVARENEALLAALLDMRTPPGHGVYPTDWVTVDLAYGELFYELGLDPDEGDVEDAVDVLVERGLGPDFAEGLDAWALVRVKAEDGEGAKRLQALANALDPNPVRRRLRTAIASGESSELERFRNEEDLAALSHASLLLLGAGLWQKSELAEAVVRRTVELEPDDFVSRLLLARVLNRLDRHAEAARHFTAAVALRPDNVVAWHERGVNLEELGDHAAAAELYRRVTERWPDEGHLLGHLGLALFFQGRFEESHGVFLRAVEAAPEDPQAVGNLGVVQVRVGDLAGARQSLERAIELDPGNARHWNNLGSAAVAAGDPDAALRHFRRAAQVQPNAKYLAGVAWHTATLDGFEQRDLTGAVTLAERSTRLAPDDADHWNTLGVVLYRHGEPLAAIEALERAHALRAAPDAIDCLFLAMAHAKLEDGAEARKWYDVAVRRIGELESPHELLPSFHAEAQRLLGIEEEESD